MHYLPDTFELGALPKKIKLHLTCSSQDCCRPSVGAEDCMDGHKPSPPCILTYCNMTL